MLSRHMNSILFANTNRFSIPAGLLEEGTNINMALSMNRNLESYGYTLDTEALKRLSTLSKDEMSEVYSNLLFAVREKTGANLFENAKLFYPNWPEEVMEKSDMTLYINSLFYYAFSQHNDEVMNAIADAIRDSVTEQKKERLPLLEEFPRELKVINAATDMDLHKMMNTRIHSLNMSKEQLNELKDYANEYRTEFNKFISSDEPYQSKETKVKIALMLHDEHRNNELPGMLKDAVDVLRFAAMLSKRNGMNQNNVELAPVNGQQTAFKFTNAEKKLVRGLLNECKGLYADIWRQKEMFHRLKQRINPTLNNGCPERVVKAFDNLSSGKKLDEFGKPLYNAENELNAGVKKLNETGNAAKLNKIAEMSPGVMMRDYISIVKHVNPEYRDKAIEIIDKIKTSDSITLNDVLKLKNEIELRKQHQEDIESGKPAVNVYAHHDRHYVKKIEEMPGENKFSENEFKAMVNAVKNAAAEMIRGNQALGKVYVEEGLKNYKAPDRRMRDASGGAEMVPYSHIDEKKDKNLLIFGVNWGMVPNSSDTGIDVDLSTHFYDENFKSLGDVSFVNLKNRMAVHSGDWTYVRQGRTSTEMIVADKSMLEKYNVRYLTTEVHCFSIDSFKQAGNCHFIFQEREGNLSDVSLSRGIYVGDVVFNGEGFDPSAVDVNILMTSDAQSTVPVVYDVQEGKMYWLDYSIKTPKRLGPSTTSNESQMAQTIAEIHRSHNNAYADLYDLFTTFASTNGELVNDIKEADTVFAVKNIDKIELGLKDDVRIVTSRDLDAISKEFSGNDVVVPEQPVEKVVTEPKEHPLLAKFRELSNMVKELPEYDRDFDIDDEWDYK